MIFQSFNLSPRLDVLTDVIVGASTEIPQMLLLDEPTNHLDIHHQPPAGA